MKRLLVILTLCFTTESLYAQRVNLRPDGISGSAGVGFAVFNVRAPNNLNLRVDDGVFAGLGVEKGFGAMNLYLTFGLSYLDTKGQVNYDYTPLSGSPFTASGVSFDANFMQANLGFKLKLLEDYWFRPYLEGGGLGGYFSIKYKNIPSAPKLSDSLLDFGSYYEGGVEVSFSDAFGVKLAARFTNNETKELDTLGNQKFRYLGQVYYLSALKAF